MDRAAYWPPWALDSAPRCCCWSGSGECRVIRCDALIVGGGPAGLAAAIALRQKGLDVLVADALRPPVDKACGEGLMPDAQKDLAALGVPRQAGAPFEGVAFLSGQQQAVAPFTHGSGIGIRRLRLHELLVARCRE